MPALIPALIVGAAGVAGAAISVQRREPRECNGGRQHSGHSTITLYSKIPTIPTQGSDPTRGRPGRRGGRRAAGLPRPRWRPRAKTAGRATNLSRQHRIPVRSAAGSRRGGPIQSRRGALQFRRGGKGARQPTATGSRRPMVSSTRQDLSGVAQAGSSRDQRA